MDAIFISVFVCVHARVGVSLLGTGRAGQMATFGRQDNERKDFKECCTDAEIGTPQNAASRLAFPQVHHTKCATDLPLRRKYQMSFEH